MYSAVGAVLKAGGAGRDGCLESPVGALLLCFSNSDDNLLKNIELFDKLSLRFNGRVLFIKDVIGDEICCWSFYGQGRKLAEVCCTSIVYATEKKQTKVMEPRLPLLRVRNGHGQLGEPTEFLWLQELSCDLQWCS